MNTENNEVIVNFSADEFSMFTRGLSLLRDICNDVDLFEGIIRQRSNDKSCIFEINMSSFINESRLPIIQIKQKLDLFKIFSNQDVSVSINEKAYVFADQYSSIRFLSPKLDYVDNKYMTLEELEEIFVLNDDDLILETSITHDISERIKTISSSFNTSSIEILFDNELANIVCSTQAGDQKAFVLKDIVTNRKMPNVSTNLVSIPFIVDHDGTMNLKMYNIKNNILINKFNSVIGDIDFSIYSRSMFSSEE